ncbi:ATP-dependent RNA helicase dbp6 [Tulasnella sp. 330]|nr:ATP-dependent RNA helicase dbp6 [Tulasnella sp. 330]
MNADALEYKKDRAERKRAKRERKEQLAATVDSTGPPEITDEIPELATHIKGYTGNDERKRQRKEEKRLRRLREMAPAASAALPEHEPKPVNEHMDIDQPETSQPQTTVLEADPELEARRRRKKELKLARRSKSDHLDTKGEPSEKRRKLDEIVEVKEPSIPGADEQADQRTIETAVDCPAPAEEPGYLPAFPRPMQPEAPSKASLYLQGLDKALSRARVVDSTLTLPLPPLSDDGKPDSFGISTPTRRRLEDMGITELFAVQTAVLPFLLGHASSRLLYTPYYPPKDACISAPTGSGKTLAYVIPIIETLSARVITRLRALVVLPTRDLVSQVRETFDSVAKGRGIKIGAVTGQHPFSHEQSQLVADMTNPFAGGSSKLDILICTPGRLMDHLNGTPNFTLQHLRFLVIDEADRLITQSFQNWLPQVLSAQKPPEQNHALSDAPAVLLGEQSSVPSLPKPDAVAPTWMSLLNEDYTSIPVQLDEVKASSCQKLLFSATLTSDPSKIAALDLRDPKYFIVKSIGNGTGDDDEAGFSEQFAVPETLKEHMVITDSMHKPLVLFYLIHSHSVTNALVFTKSTESTSRLVRLFEFFERSRTQDRGHVDSGKTVVARAFSSDLSPMERKMLLRQFRAGEIDILVCSDLISRGMDISHVNHVVNYDVPLDMRRYVHRVGRTARAGRQGDAWSLVETQEARHFKAILSSHQHLKQVKKIKIDPSQLQFLQPHYETALGALKDVYAYS